MGELSVNEIVSRFGKSKQLIQAMNETEQSSGKRLGESPYDYAQNYGDEPYQTSDDDEKPMPSLEDMRKLMKPDRHVSQQPISVSDELVEVIRDTVEEVMSRYLGEGVLRIGVGDKFQVLMKDGNLYEAQLSFKKNVKDKKK